MGQYVEITKNGYLSVPKRSVKKMQLRAGMRFKLLADEDDILVLRIAKRKTSMNKRLKLSLGLKAKGGMQ